jgi:ACR3 family arsenite efflux pump ArsB
MQIILVVLAAILGLTYGYQTDGLQFTSKICLFAGITLIMPTLFNVKLKDIKLILTHKKILFKSMVINFIALPVLALAIGLATKDFGIAAGIFALSVLSGGGMVMHWVKKTDANASLGFILLFINIIFISLSLLMLHLFAVYTEEYFGEFYADSNNSLTGFANAVILYLIVVPLVLSRILIYMTPVVTFINKYRPIISNVSIFIIITFLFSLQNSQLLFEVYDFEPELIAMSFYAIAAFYIGNFLIAKFTFDVSEPDERSAFWFTTTRYITLALIIASFSIASFGVTMLIPIMMSYLIQIPFAIFYAKYVK